VVSRGLRPTAEALGHPSEHGKQPVHLSSESLLDRLHEFPVRWTNDEVAIIRVRDQWCERGPEQFG